MAARLLVLFLALWALRTLVSHLAFVVVPVAVALLLAAACEPLVRRLARRGTPRGLAAFAAMLGGAVVVGGLVAFAVLSVVNNLPELGRQLTATLDAVRTWLAEGPLRLDDQQLRDMFGRLREWLTQHQQSLVSGTMGVFSTLGQVLAGGLLTLVILVLLLYDGPKIWDFLLRPWRPATREFVDDAGRTAFHDLTRYVGSTALVALIDALGIGLGLVPLGVPLAVPLAALVFLGAFVPYVGAFVSGAIAVGIALVTNGPVTALIVLGIVVAVQQLEGQLLQPLLTGNLVRLHPLAVLLAIVVGGAEAGIAGALLAVPVLSSLRAVLVAAGRHRARED